MSDRTDFLPTITTVGRPLGSGRGPYGPYLTPSVSQVTRLRSSPTVVPLSFSVNYYVCSPFPLGVCVPLFRRYTEKLSTLVLRYPVSPTTSSNKDGDKKREEEVDLTIHGERGESS